MRRVLGVLPLLGLSILWASPPPAHGACCYFAAKDKDILQPAQKAFITWDPVEKVESFTVQPKFEGNAADFGMVIPTPTKPKLDEMPREFFKELAVFTILEPMDLSKYKKPRPRYFGGRGGAPARAGAPGGAPAAPPLIRILDAGVVGSLDYKVLEADRADALYEWLKDNKYSYGGDEATLDFYIKKKWIFTVMKIDTMQMKKKADGTFEGDVTPTRFTFASEKLVYPLKITQLSVKDKTEALFYVQTTQKMDLTGDFSYQETWTPMWSQATTYALPEKLTEQEKTWQQHVQSKVADFTQQAQQVRQKGHEPATLEWARKINDHDLDVLQAKAPYNRNVPKEDVDKLKLLKGHVQKGQFITKLRKVFHKDEMETDLEFVPARVGDQKDEMEYTSILPTSPP